MDKGFEGGPGSQILSTSPLAILASRQWLYVENASPRRPLVLGLGLVLFRVPGLGPAPGSDVTLSRGK